MGESSRTLLLTWVAGLALGAAGYQGIRQVGETQRFENGKAAAVGIAREREDRPEDRTEAIKARLIAVMGSDSEFTEEDAQELVRALVAHPDFINALWEGDHSENRLEHMDAVLSRLASDCPTKLWTVIDQARFSFAEVDHFRFAAEAGVRATPEQAFEVSGRKGVLLGTEFPVSLDVDPFAASAAFDTKVPSSTADELRVMAVRKSPEVARLALEEMRMGKPLTATLKEALLDPKVLPEGEAELPDDFLDQPGLKAIQDRRQREETFDTWLHGEPLSDEELKKMPVRDLLGYCVDSEGLGIQPQRLEALARAGDDAGIDGLLENLVTQGRTTEAAALVGGARELVPEKRDKLLAQVATDAYDWTGDPQSSLRALDTMSNGAARQAAGEEILWKWAGEAPGEALEYLPQVKDEALRAKLSEIIEQQSRR